MNEVSGTLESLCLSVCLSVRLCRFVFGLSRYFALTLDYHIWHMYHHETMCTYIHDPDTMLTFDLKVKFIGFYFFFDVGLTYLAHESITMRGCVAYIHDPGTPLTFDLEV